MEIFKILTGLVAKKEVNQVEYQQVVTNMHNGFLSAVAEAEAYRLERKQAATEAENTDSAYAVNSYTGPSDLSDGLQAGELINPAKGTITQSFSSSHTGMDIANTTGTPVLATANGVVIKASFVTRSDGDKSYGNCIELDHGNGVTSLYAHLSVFEVKVGQVVTQGQEIGKMGSTGRSTGPHLHFEVRVNGKQVNPTSYM